MFGQKLMADNPKKQKMWVTISLNEGCSSAEELGLIRHFSRKKYLSFWRDHPPAPAVAPEFSGNPETL
jgi:hypothetical protein